MKKVLLLSIISVFIIACAQQVKKEGANEQSEFLHPDSIVNPNGDSELALVMRHFHFEADKISKKIEKGEPIDLSEIRNLAQRLQTAVPTDSSVLDEDYYNFSESILAQIDHISEGQAFEFNSMVGTCVACHRNTCPGPITKINKLMIES